MHILVFILCIETLGVPAVAATVPSFTVAVLVSYFANRRWVFSASGRHQVFLPKFLVVQIAGLALNAGITFLVVDLLRLWYGVALAFCVTAVPLITFMLHRRWTFGTQVNS